MEHWNEQMPTPAQREEAIAAILDQGLPSRPGLLAAFRSALDVRVLFGGVTDCIFLSILAAILLMLPLFAGAVRMMSPAVLLFLGSPALYALLLGSTAWKEGQSGLLEWKQTCRLSPKVTAALRMAVFGGASVLVCVPGTLWLWQVLGGPMPLSWMLGVSLSSLFLYGLLTLACLERGGRGHLAVPPVLWAALGGVLWNWDRAAAWLTALPGAVFLALAGGALALYLIRLRRFCLGQRKGENYAVG